MFWLNENKYRYVLKLNVSLNSIFKKNFVVQDCPLKITSEKCVQTKTTGTVQAKNKSGNDLSHLS